MLYRIGIPFYFVNGNDDLLEYHNGGYFLNIIQSPIIIEDRKYILDETLWRSKLTIKVYEHQKNPLAIDEQDSEHKSGVHSLVKPNFGNFIIKSKEENINCFGFKCNYGLESEIENEPTKDDDIYLSHLPPLGVLDLSTRYGIKHIGSAKLLGYILRYRPKLVICGHSHLWGGRTEKIGETQIINVSSHDSGPVETNFAIIDTKDWSFELKKVGTVRTVRGIASLRRYLQEMSMELRGGYTENKQKVQKTNEAIRILSKWKNGSISTTDDAIANIQELFKLEFVEKAVVDSLTRIKDRVFSFNWDKPKQIKKITINPYNQAFIDVETGLFKDGMPGRLWLIGIYYRGHINQYLYPKNMKSFLNYIQKNNITSLASWTDYDHKVLRPIFQRLRTNKHGI